MDAKFIEILEDRGWLAFDSLYFDNGYEIKIAIQKGLIAYDKTNKVFINVLSNAHHTNQRMRGSVAYDQDLIDGKKILNDYAQISMTGTEHLQRYLLSSYKMRNHLDGTEDISALSIINPKTIREAGTPPLKTLLVKGAGSSTDGDPVEVSLYDSGDFAHIDKKKFDDFVTKQTQFKAFLVTNYGFTLGDLV